MPSTDRQAAPSIIAVDDDPDHLALVSRWLSAAGMQVTAVDSGSKALAALELQRPNLVITDLVMDGMDGLKLLSAIHGYDPVLPVMILSGQARIPDAINAAHLGVCGFLTKPISRERLLQAVDEALQRQNDPHPGSEADFGNRLIHRSYLMTEVLERARLVAQVDSTVLLNGETGTGKEVVARAIHDAGPRRERPFVTVNCSALPEQLLESELFGHEKGAFTGALQKHQGLFKAADRGTLFLDEIGDMPLTVQAKVLRVLQDFQVRPVGATQPIPVDVRIISATHRDLEAQVRSGEFREDLYYRLNVVPLQLPPLRDRRDDIPLLIDHFLDTMATQSGRPRKHFSPEAMQYLISAGWPGNIRQLRNVVEQCSVLCISSVIPINLAKGALRDQPGEILPLDEARLAFERRYLVSVLRATNGNITAAAKMAGRNRTEFYKLLNRHGLEPATFREKNTESQENAS